MPTTTNYGWTTPADTDLVKDGASAIRTLGTAIDTTVFNNASAAIAKTIVDAKGDIIAATAADTVSRLAVGANDTVLTADSSTATGLKWAAPAASGGITLISTTTLTSNTTVSLTSIPQTYKNLYIIVNDAYASTANDLQFRVNGNTANGKYQGYRNGTSSVTFIDSLTTPAIQVESGTTTKVDAIITFYNYTNTSYTKLFDFFGRGAQGYNNFRGIINSTSAITSINIANGDGAPVTFSGGVAYLFGVS